jgi:signal transduction histidine kinase
MRKRRLNLLQRFSLLSLLSVLAFCAGLGWVTSRVLTGNMLAGEWQDTAELVRYQIRAYRLQPLFTDPALRADAERYRASLGPFLNLPEVVKVKVWDREGAVIWATDPRIVGQKFADNPELRTSLAGQVTVQLKPLRKAEHLYDREQFVQLAEVYVPIFAEGRPGQIIGVLEVYKVPGRLFATIHQVTLLVWGSVAVGGLLLYLSLFWIVRVAYRSQLRLERSLEARSSELADRNATLEFFLQSVSHDLRTAAVAVNGLAGRLLESHAGALGEEGRRLLRRLQANAEHQHRLLADLLTLSRVGRDASPLREVDVTVLVRQVVEETLTDLDRGPVKVTVPDSLDTLVASISELRAIFGHVVSNAVEFMGDQPAPEIEIGAADRGDRVEFSVRDNGPGIDPAYHAKIFELFERLEVAESKGTGVGLTIVKRIVESVGGRVWVESEPGRGSTFRFIVPRVWPARYTALRTSASRA